MEISRAIAVTGIYLLLLTPIMLLSNYFVYIYKKALLLRKRCSLREKLVFQIQLLEFSIKVINK